MLLTLSASDLLQATPERAAAHASDLRQRLDEITAHLGIAVPVYVLVTKTDLLPGFTELSMFPSLWQASGLAYPDLIADLIGQALARPNTVVR